MTVKRGLLFFQQKVTKFVPGLSAKPFVAFASSSQNSLLRSKWYLSKIGNRKLRNVLFLAPDNTAREKQI